MKKQIENVVVHISQDRNFDVLADKINEFHVGLIEQKLNECDLTSKQKICVIDGIIENLKV